MRRVQALVVAGWLAALVPLAKVPATAAVDFPRDVYPILRTHCISCHGPRRQEGGLRLDSRQGFLRGGDSGPVVVPGKPEASALWQRVTAQEEAERMPQEAPPLSSSARELLRRWILEGAPWPDGVGTAPATSGKHWAYVPPVRPPLPPVANRRWVRNPIDRFILARLEREGLSPSQAAPPAILLRRLYLDLIGVPPTPEQVDAFLADRRPDRYERLVDSLLASPLFGQHWARPWLDAARYADSNGYQADQYRSVWAYRDWVIDALNSDMPFDRFTVEQIAGDLLEQPTTDQRIATGFARLTTCNVEAGVDPEENRVEQVVDRVNTLATVWLGTTMECAQCHDHKYDPFTTEEYYQLFAFFNNTPLEVEGDGVTYDFVGPKMELPLSAEQAEKRQQLLQQQVALRRQLQQRQAELLKQYPQWEKDLLVEAAPAQWQPATVEHFSSLGGARGELQTDGSVLVTGPLPDVDTYEVTCRIPAATLAAIRLEALAHPALPGKGPGRHHPQRPNFVLNELQLFLLQQEDKLLPLKVATAQADYSQRSYPVMAAVDGDIKTGWAIHPEFGKGHVAIFVLEQPVEVPADARLVVRMVQNHGGGRTLGCFRLSVTGQTPRQQALPQPLGQILAKDPRQWTPKDRQQLQEYFLQQDSRWKSLQDRLAALERDLEALKPDTTLVMVEMDKPRETRVLRRGNYRDPGQRVQPGVPRALNPWPEGAPRNRLGLAQWLVDPANPLVARVTVNRWWAEIFGRGIVETVEDFGTQGEPPSHPELLDWLAVELVQSGWSMKHILRLIVTSATYRQSSALRPELLQRDPENRLYGRQARFRLPAEGIRDHGLAASGLLCTQFRGPPIYPPQPPGIWRHVGRNAPKYLTSQGADRFRRGVYVIWRRSAPYPSFVTFDAPDRASCVVKRPRSNTPLQALALMNDQAYAEMALGLAVRVLRALPQGSDEKRVRYAMRCCVVREPGSEEVEHLVRLLDQQRQMLQQQPQRARQRLAPLLPHVLPGQSLESMDRDRQVELAAWWLVANVLLNLDETITRP